MSLGLAKMRAAEAWGMRERISPGVVYEPFTLLAVSSAFPQNRIEPSKQDPD